MPAPTVTKTKPQPKPKPGKSSSSVKTSPSPSSTPAAALPDELPPGISRLDELENGGLRGILEDLYVQRNIQKSMADEAEAERKRLDEQIQSILWDLQVKKVDMQDGRFLNLRKGRSPSKLDSHRLLLLGVTADQIKSSTVPGAPYFYVQVTDNNENTDEETVGGRP